MWSKLDDALIDHRKVFQAGDVIGRNGPGIALGAFTLGLLYANKHLTDGFLSESVVRHWRHFAQPLKVAEALVDAHLWDRVEGGYQIHDFHDFNPRAAFVRKDRAELSLERAKAGRLGAQARWQKG